ncbi:hypothetical protein H6CHR_00677 [Variovorax sp. PBL-H6]|uniref:hypothetical protein n=1 Tax=Variovorax sp. PBL-H6 TaxID=434009 RepID=UPI0013171EF2|nr:hypothetical protein [Variovorax sp. PBL-H6]VTU17052.1 hypothetical protein H6CHR_00677 [Variovorax sp. PBL-H6]
MRLFSSLQKRITPAQQQYTPLVNEEPTDSNEEPTDSGAWKARLAGQLPPLHDRSPFDQLISDYLTEDEKPDVSLVVCECIKHGNVDVLACILANEDIRTLCIEGPVDGRGWKTLAKAMPDSLLVAELQLSQKVILDAGKCEDLFRVLSRMPALENLSLRSVKVKRGFLFDQLRCPALPMLAKLQISGSSNPKVGVYPLVREILKACQVQSLSIDVSGAITARQHSKLAGLLHKQNRMSSLRLRIERRATPEEFECYMPFLCGKTPTPLVELDLTGCCVQVGNFNKLIEALSSNQPALESLLIGACSVAGDPNYREIVNIIDLLPLARVKRLQHLDLSSNHLPKGKMVALLKALKEAKLLS